MNITLTGGNPVYREFRPQTAEAIDITLIPYYAWDNRGLSEMKVWLPVT